MKISWIPNEFINEAGSLGLSHSPGIGDESTERDLCFLKSIAIDTIICLQQEHEFNFFDPIETLPERKGKILGMGMDFTHYPIEDFQAPSLNEAKIIVDQIIKTLNSNKKIVIHCMFGLGRAGTVAAYVLVKKGMSAHGAIAMMRWIRPGAIQSFQQEESIFQYEQSLQQENPHEKIKKISNKNLGDF